MSVTKQSIQEEAVVTWSRGDGSGCWVVVAASAVKS